LMEREAPEMIEEINKMMKKVSGEKA